MQPNTKLSEIDLANFSDRELLLLRTHVDEEMRERGLAYSVGDVGEEVAIDYFNSTAGLPNLQKAPVGTKNIDAISRDGNRYSIKSICRGKKTGTVYPDRDDEDKQLFEFLLIIKLKDNWTLNSIHQFDWETFCATRAWDTRMNAWYVPVSQKSLSAAQCIVEVQ